MADGARMLPILGFILFMLPLLWMSSGQATTAMVMVYLFIAWAALAGVAGLLSRRLGPEEDQPEDKAPDPEDKATDEEPG